MPKPTAAARALALLGGLLAAAWPPTAGAYITAPVPTLGELCGSTYITLVQVEKFSKEKGVIIYRKVRDLKGTYPRDQIRHAFDLKNTPLHQGPGDVPVRPDDVDWRYALDWAEVGKTAVVFSRKYDPYGDFGHTYIDKCWYATMCPARDWDFWWSIYSDPALLGRWHCGTPAQLAAAVDLVLAGKTAVVPTLVQGSRDEFRQGKGRIQGLRVGTQIQDYNPERDRVADFLLKDLAAIQKDLESPDRARRLEGLHAAATAGSEARAALPKVLPLTEESDEELRLAALAALQRMDPENARIVAGAAPFLKHADPERRIRAVELLIAAPAGSTPKDLLPAAAALLELPDPELRRRSALALGRLGTAATPAVGVLAKLLQEPDRELRLQAAEALGQIGGEAASPRWRKACAATRPGPFACAPRRLWRRSARRPGPRVPPSKPRFAIRRWPNARRSWRRFARRWAR
jgi:HEAT repeat protein